MKKFFLSLFILSLLALSSSYALAQGIITTVAGTGTQGYSGDGGPATQAQFSWPSVITVDIVGNLYIADEYNNRVRKVDINGTISTIAGTGTAGFSGDGGPAILVSRIRNILTNSFGLFPKK